MTIQSGSPVNAGVRFDHSRAISLDIPAVVRWKRPTRPSWFGHAGGTSSRHVWASPRG